MDQLPGGKTTAALGLFAFMILKVLVVAKGDLPTALGILKAAGPVPVLVGTLVSGLPTLAAVATVICAYWWDPTRARVARSGWGRVDASWPVAVSFLLGVAFAPIILFGGSLLTAVGAGPLRRTLRARRSGASPAHPGRKSATDIGSHWVMAILVSALAAVALYQMWLPHEWLRIGAGQTNPRQILVGSVLEENSEWMTVLVSGQRTLVRLKSATVVGRALCDKLRSHPLLEDSLPDLIRYRSSRAPCPRSTFRPEQPYSGGGS